MGILKRPKIGIALGSGSSRGFAHIGILRVFEEEGIPIDYIAGTSIGAYVGAIFAAGALKDFEDFILSLDWKALFKYYDIKVSKSGLFSGKKIMEVLEVILDGRGFEDLLIPFSCVAVDINKAKEVVFKSGDLLRAIRASLSMPGVFTPVEYDGMLLVDGGIMNPVPVDIVRDMGADIVIAVDLSGVFVDTPSYIDVPLGLERRRKWKKGRKWRNRIPSNISMKLRDWVSKAIRLDKEVQTKPFVVDLILASIDIMISEITKLKLSMYKPEIIISPELTDMRFIDFYKAKEAIDEGKRVAYNVLEKLKSMLKKKLLL